MEVTQLNFNEVLPELKKSLEHCTFISIDCEMTGLKLSSNRIGAYDTPKQYYEKLFTDCKEFLVLQYGISLFRYVEDENIFKHHSYNFYIFRRPENKYIQDQRFLCQTSSMDFLIKNNFDFNKVFKQGISYMNDFEENRCKEFLLEQLKKRVQNIESEKKSDTSEHIPVPENCQKFMEEITKTLEVFLDSSNSDIQLPICNGFMRRLIYELVAKKYSAKISLETRQVESDRILFASRLKTKDTLKQLEKSKYDESLKQLDDFIGFGKVVRLLVDSEKPIVGHNLMYDFMHTIDKFITPLPEDYEDFKDCAISLFTNIFDTKFLATSEPFKSLIKSSVLKDVLDSLNESPFEMPKTEVEQGKKSYTISDIKEHEAGYDAYITGLCFIAFWKYLGTERKLLDSTTFGPSGKKLLSSYANKIFLMYLTDNQYVNLAGSDVTPPRNHVFYLTFPKEWKTENITQLFSPFGPVNISWISDCTAYVGLYKKDQAGLALKTLSKGDKYTIMTYAKRKSILEGTNSIKRKTSSEFVWSSSEGPGKRRKADSLDRASLSTSGLSIEPKEEEEAESSGEEISYETSTSMSSTPNVKDKLKNVKNIDKIGKNRPTKKSKTVFDECHAWE